MSYIEWIELLLLIVFIALMMKYFLSKSSRIPYEWKQAVDNEKVPHTVRSAWRSFNDKSRFYYFWYQLERIKKEHIEGDLAELGVYKGHSAKIIHKVIPDRPLHLFDTFSGFIESDLKIETGKASEYNSKSFADCSVSGVKEHIKGNENLVFHKGDFSEIIKTLKPLKFAFANS
jgi:O-methyltransferase